MLSRAAGITVYGYGAPVTDVEAVELMKSASHLSQMKDIAPFTIINLAKNEEYKEMKKCILVWQVPVIEGEPYNPVEYAVHVRKAKKFAEALNRYFAEKNMDYNCVLDKSACSLDEIFSPQYQAVLFAPEAKTRQWLYKKEVQNETVKKYYLEYMEYNSAQIEKVAEFLSE